jgi:hypothetical protein
MMTAVDGGAGDTRANARSNVFLSATLLASGKSLPVRVRNISSTGALIDGQTFPAEGSIVQLRRGSLTADGQIVWLSEDQCGVRFATEVDVDKWVKRPGHSGQERVDNIVNLVQRGRSPGSDMMGSSDDSLSAIGLALSQICDRLSASATMVADFPEELLALDSIAQRLRQALGRLDGRD